MTHPHTRRFPQPPRNPGAHTLEQLRRSLGLAAIGAWALLGSAPAALALDMDDVVTGNTLRLLAERPDPGAYWYESRVRISADSLRSGVVDLHTCHHRLDGNHHIVVAFNPERVQHIALASSEGVGSAQVNGHRVDLRDVRTGGSVCIDLRSRALEPQGDGQWRMHAGPLMRRYLDGYLPMQAKLNFEWPSGLLMLNATEPAAQPGVNVSQSESGAQMDITFAGRMRATLDLRRPGSPLALQSKANPEATSLNVGVPLRLE
jgi:hypothetical protein